MTNNAQLLRNIFFGPHFKKMEIYKKHPIPSVRPSVPVYLRNRSLLFSEILHEVLGPYGMVRHIPGILIKTLVLCPGP